MKVLIVTAAAMCAVLMVCASGIAQVSQQRSAASNPYIVHAKQPEVVTHYNLVIWGKSGPLVSIGMDGKITYGEGYTPDGAARVFWEAMGRRAAECEKKP